MFVYASIDVSREIFLFFIVILMLLYSLTQYYHIISQVLAPILSTNMDKRGGEGTFNKEKEEGNDRGKEKKEKKKEKEKENPEKYDNPASIPSADINNNISKIDFK